MIGVFMNKKLVKEFLIITFVIMLIFWGGCALISQIFILTINNIFLRIMHIIGGFSPTIASYISLKRNNEVKNLKEWLKKIFDIKHNIWTYALVILFVLIYYVLGCAINDMLPSYRTMKYKSPIWGYFHVQKKQN